MDLKKLVNELLEYNSEREWFEFKINWYEQETNGEYISALSNAAALVGKEKAYMVWGITDKTHEIVGTYFDQYRDYKGEPFLNFLNRNLSPKIDFTFEEVFFKGKRLVVLIIDAANEFPTSFMGVRYLRMGSAKIQLRDAPRKEKDLFRIFEHGYPSIINTEAQYQELTFKKLFVYFATKGIAIREETFKKNLNLLTKNGKYNIQAQLLSDDSHFPIRVCLFDGLTKGSNLYSVKEFGYDCILFSLQKLLDYGEVINFIFSDETNRKEERKDEPLFDIKAFNEAIVNAILHNKRVDQNEPMISVYVDRIEILSRGTLAPKQTIEGFFRGESVPVNESLSDIFARLRISDKSGRGVPKIIENYGRSVFEFRENSILLKLPFNEGKYIKHFTYKNDYFKSGESDIKLGNKLGNKPGDKPGDKLGNKLGNKKYENELNKTQNSVLNHIIKNPYITGKELAKKLRLSVSAIELVIDYLKNSGYIRRAGAKKNGKWEILK